MPYPHFGEIYLRPEEKMNKMLKNIYFITRYFWRETSSISVLLLDNVCHEETNIVCSNLLEITSRSSMK
jgi:hypothetical protein